MYRSPSRLTLRAVTKRFADRLVLDGVDLSVRPGERVGIVGDNGSGKSTLLGLIGGALEPDEGEVIVSAAGGVGHLAQTLELEASATVQAAIDAALAELRDLEQRVADAERALSALDGSELAEALEEYGVLVEQFAARDGHAANRRLGVALDALGVGRVDRARRWASLSGGERSRVALAATLAADPELLLLDEPTNDLDDDAWEWLLQRLRTHRGTVVAVTHDRAFLEALTEVVWEVDARSVARHGDGYAGYLAAKARERRQAIEAHASWTEELARQRQLASANAARVDAIPRKMEKAGMGIGQFRMRSRDHGSMSRIRNAKERVARLTENPVDAPPEPLAFTPRLATVSEADASNTSEPAIELAAVRVGERLSVDHLRIDAGERLLVTGPNGAGKTTLLRLISGELRPDGGTVSAPRRIGHLQQASTITPTGETLATAFAARARVDLETGEATLGALGLFRPDDLAIPLSALSYGQRRRLELALLVASHHDVLLLDEPTNHLAPALVDELELALEGFRGTVVLVTHDRRMRERFTGRRVRVRNGTVDA
ncbi:macrolide transport system ATP-binding/permease protein [Agromyces cerinus]|uniref:ribosomal protection-like ABC-F family protein n=1 Tax=Agromyces cerinus TaxID=33878 RepID=UPI00195D7993|nr:ABC-F family ATP-binding cassette domain-containing protein [Agromyces cerinus]MBM7831603.1 macrolide transport system ATP-binding/permease protein [Agromyces cerinus]